MSLVLERTQAQAAAELSRIFCKYGVFCIRVTGARVSGKTTLLGATLAAMPNVKHAAIVALAEDGKQSNDRVYRSESLVPEEGREAEQILEAISSWDLDELDVLFIETGRTSARGVGEHATVVLFSAADREDLPLRDPGCFLAADLCLITKTDLLSESQFNVALASRNVAHVHPGIEILEISSVTADGLNRWMKWVELRKRAALEAFALHP